eukprot:TRINITY_DN7621_c0_g1_i2.p1 TRINITY_DN7621_c0_g1~~TRINITY_DN7621_c0_g1_i2.p1  ORF type:complete len:760 (+),score=229.93 TRINITY_DN7621_c0_g1_i2:206-2485(+)
MATVLRHALGEVVLSVDTQPAGIHGHAGRSPAADEAQTQAVLTELVLPEVEPPAAGRRRAAMLDSVDELFQAWAGAMEVPKAYVLVYGSVRLNLQLPDADTDCLCVAAPGKGRGAAALREQFFATFPLVLHKELKGVAEMQVVKNAIVPVIKLAVDGVQLDLAFAVVPGLASPRDVDDGASTTARLQQLGSDEVMEREHNSIAGVRGGEAIARGVPSMEVFWVAARAVKSWAMRRGIYGGVYGYLGGGAIAIMVAAACQRAPLVLPPELLRLFFAWYAKLLRHIVTAYDARFHNGDASPLRPSAARPWTTVPRGLGVRPDAERPGADSAIISITDAAVAEFFATVPTWAATDEPRLYVVNPVYPYSNNTRNVTPQQLRHLCEEFERASDVVAGRVLAVQPWRVLAAAHAFLTAPRHKLFVLVALVAETDELLRQYGSLVCSRMRLFPGCLEAAAGPQALAATLLPQELHPPTGALPDLVEGGPGTACGAHLVALAPQDGAPSLSVPSAEALAEAALREFMGSLKPLQRRPAGVTFPVVKVYAQGALPAWVTAAVAGGDAAAAREAPPARAASAESAASSSSRTDSSYLSPSESTSGGSSTRSSTLSPPREGTPPAPPAAGALPPTVRFTDVDAATPPPQRGLHHTVRLTDTSLGVVGEVQTDGSLKMLKQQLMALEAQRRSATPPPASPAGPAAASPLPPPAHGADRQSLLEERQQQLKRLQLLKQQREDNARKRPADAAAAAAPPAAVPVKRPKRNPP